MSTPLPGHAHASSCAPSGRGFTLLEVLVAVAILGLGLTMILSSQVGLFASASRGEHLTIATNLARCKMSELELDLLKKGYPVTDTRDEGRCCGDDTEPGYECAWRIERVSLPEQPLDGGGAMDASLGPLGALAGFGKKNSGTQGTDPLSALGGALPGSGLSGLGGPAGSSKPNSLQDMAASVGNASAGLGPMVMGMVYPSLKPMLEASIRKLTVRVKWKEGIKDKDLTVTQYLTDPQQGGLDGGTGPMGVGGGTGTSSTTTNPPTNSVTR